MGKKINQLKQNPKMIQMIESTTRTLKEQLTVLFCIQEADGQIKHVKSRHGRYKKIQIKLPEVKKYYLRFKQTKWD